MLITLRKLNQNLRLQNVVFLFNAHTLKKVKVIDNPSKNLYIAPFVGHLWYIYGPFMDIFMGHIWHIKGAIYKLLLGNMWVTYQGQGLKYETENLKKVVENI